MAGGAPAVRRRLGEYRHMRVCSVSELRLQNVAKRTRVLQLSGPSRGGGNERIEHRTTRKPADHRSFTRSVDGIWYRSDGPWNTEEDLTLGML